jgi:hypothetical protein
MRMTQKTLLTMHATYLGHVARMTFVQKQLWMGTQALVVLPIQL